MLAGQSEIDRGFMAQMRTAVWAKGEDFELVMNPPPEDDDGALAQGLAAFGMRVEG